MAKKKPVVRPVKVPAQPQPTPANPVRAHYKLATGKS